METDEREIRYLCVEANKFKAFYDGIRLKTGGKTIIVPNLSYGLIAITPILSILKRENAEISLSKIGSSNAHGNRLILENDSLPTDEGVFSKGQPNYIVVDGTRNVHGMSPEHKKYPDSQQGYLNYVIIMNDVITDNDFGAYIGSMGVSERHVKALRDTSEYQIQRSRLEGKLKNKGLKPFSFDYWNPAGRTLHIYNHGEDCEIKRSSLDLSEVKQNVPKVVFVNSVMNFNNHSFRNMLRWGKHTPAYFDDDGRAKSFQFKYGDSGIFLTSEIGEQAQRIYQELYGDKK